MNARLSVALHGVSVRRGEKWALRDVSLTLRAGERWALIGANGAGKTQLLKLIAADVWPTPTGRETRTYKLGRRRVDLIEAKQHIVYIGAELQDKYARYHWNLQLGDLLATGLHRTDLVQRPATLQERRLVGAMLELCGLTPIASRRFLTLSYGQQRLALLARGLIQAPDWLLLDEFYNGLDGEYRARIDRMLKDAQGNGAAWVVSAHRAADVPRGTQGLIELRAGKLHSIKRLQDADLARLAAQAGEVLPEGRKRPRGAGPPGKLLLRIRNADVYVDYRAVLRGLSWDLRRGEQWAVFGANGAGKSTFLKLLYGDLSPALGGRLERRGFARGTPIRLWKQHVGLVSPELQTQYAVNVSVRDLVASGRHASIGLSDPPTPQDLKAARRWLEFFALSTVAKAQPQQLSYGQLRRALIARALAGDARILLLDEPLTGLDPRQRATMKRLLEKLMIQGVTLIVAVHHAEDLPRGITHALHLDNQEAAAVELRSSTLRRRRAGRV